MENTDDSLCIDNVEVVRDIGYSQRQVLSSCILVFILDVIINLDHGAMPAALTSIQNDRKLNNTQMGGLGSMVFFGILIGSMSGAFVFQKVSFKTIIMLSLLVNGISLYLFTIFTPFYLMGLMRYTSGFAQVFLIIYKPVFVDTFASKSQKSALMSLILMSPPLGVVIGYLLTAIMI